MADNTHPHMLFTADEAAALRGRLKKGPRSRVHLEHAVSLSEEYLDPGAEHFFDFKDRRSGYWHSREGNFIIPTRLLTLALTGWLADRSDFLETARDAVLTLIRENVVDALGDYTTWRRGNGHDTGKYFKMMGLLYDMLHPVMSDDENATMLRHIDETLLPARDNFREALYYRDNNRGARFLVGLSIMALAVEGEAIENEDLAHEYRQRSGLWLEMGLRYAVGRDGAFFEGSSYGGSATSFYAVAAEILPRCGKRDLRRDVRFRRAADYMLHETVLSEGRPNNFNDCKHNSYPMIVYYAGAALDAPACLWAWDRFGCNPDHPMSLVRPGRHPVDFWEMPWYLLWPDDRAPEAQPPDACGYPNARHFRDRGIVSVRSGWTADDLHVSMFSGPNHMTAHRQADQNQVTFYALGERFLIDTGYFTNDPETGERIPGVRGDAHSLVFIDGEGQAAILDYPGGSCDAWPMGRILGFAAGPDHAWTLGDAREGYARILRRAERHLHAVWKQDLPPYAVWVDDIDTDGEEHEYALLLHTAPGNRFDWEDERITIHGQEHQLDIHLATDAPVTISEDAFGDHPRLRIALRAVRGRFVMLLHPRRSGEAEAAFAADLAEDEITTIVRLGGRTLRHVFDTSERPDVYSGESVSYVRGPFEE